MAAPRTCAFPACSGPATPTPSSRRLRPISRRPSSPPPTLSPSPPPCPRYQFNCPGRDLGDGLRAFGERPNTQILFSKDLVRGRRSAALQGRLSQDAALKVLLSNSHLTFRRTSANVILVTAADDLPRVEKIAQRSAPVLAAAAVAAAPSETIAVEEVLVTAEKRPENVHDGP